MKKLIVISAPCGVGKSTVIDALNEQNILEEYVCLDSDELGLNWWDYAGTEQEERFSDDCLKEAVKKSCARTFQALRIDVNNEFEVLYTFLEKLPDVLAPGGRVAILTFHSGEDRLVKKSFKEFQREGLYSEVSKDVIRPSAEECVRNSRAKSTKMRWAIRAEG